MNIVKIIIIILFLCCLFTDFLSAGNYKQIPFIMHVHSTYSGNGVMTLGQITQAAEKKGIKVIIFNDHDLMKWQYGIWPFRSIIKKTVEKNSVIMSGPQNYLDHINNLNKKYSDMILIPGVESSAHYYWSGNILKKQLTINNWHKHLLIAGLYKPEQYMKLPVVSNEENAGNFNFMLLWPIVLLYSCIAFLKNNKAILITSIISLILLAHNFPYKSFSYDQYHGDQGDKPYQALIDYVNQTAPDTGMIFWAHPEAPNYEKPDKSGAVKIVTPKYVNSIYKTYNYTGFCYFQEGNKQAGAAGGVWDKTLIDYCNGIRKSPVWAAAELDYRKEGYLNTYIDSYKNIILMPASEDFNLHNVIKQIKAGNFYLVSKPRDSYELVMDALDINDNISISIHSSDLKEHQAAIKVIIDGKIYKTYHKTTPLYLSFSKPAQKKKTYFRFEIKADNNAMLITNPVFI